jgi:hypothetical protein
VNRAGSSDELVPPNRRIEASLLHFVGQTVIIPCILRDLECVRESPDATGCRE